MQNLAKISRPFADLTDSRRKFFSDVIGFALFVLPFVLNIFLTVSVLLLVEIFVVGAADRLGVSPKWSVLLTSLFYAVVFAGLTFLGGLKEKNITEDSPAFEVSKTSEPVCKILTIRRKEQTERINL